MNASIFHGNSPLCFSFGKQIRLGESVCSLRDGTLAFASRKDAVQFSVLSIKSDGSRKGRPPRKSSAPGRTKNEDEGASDGKIPKSAKQEKIMAMFRRIRSSISKGEAKSSRETEDGLSGKSPTESALDVLGHPEKPVKDTTAKSSRARIRALPQKLGAPKKNHEIQNDVQQSAANFNVTRPPSNFVKKSPIPSPSVQRQKPNEGNSDLSITTDSSKVLTSPRIEEMKLQELKELAKSRGIKGYSKLKKSELLELLRS